LTAIADHALGNVRRLISNTAGPRARRRTAAAAATFVFATALAGPAHAITGRTSSPGVGIRALRAAAAAAAGVAPGGVDRPTYQAAVEAYIWGYPLVVMARTRALLVCAASPNQFIHQPTLAGPGSRLVVTPNSDTLYSSAFLDLRGGPVVLRTPALTDHYYVFQFLDMYTNTIANVGTRTTGQGTNAVTVTGPGWRGRLPAGTRRISSPTPDVWVIGRTLPKDQADVAIVDQLQQQYSITPLPPRSPPEGSGRPACGVSRPAVNASGAQFFDELGAGLSADPPPSSDAPILRDLAAAGIGPGTRPSANANPAVAAALTQSVGAASVAVARSAAAMLTSAGGWNRLQHVGTYDHDYATRAEIAQVALGVNVPAESVYYSTGTDRSGAPLVGNRPATVHFAAGQLPPVDRHGFWSVTLYGPDHFLVANVLNRYAIGDRTPGLQRGSDGSLDLYLGATAPAGHEANWLPAPPGSFSLVLRAYLPGSAIRTGAWRPPRIQAPPA
jgi:hypothetical protein